MTQAVNGEWCALISEGQEVKLVRRDGSKMAFVTCVTADNAAWLVRQLHSWSKSDRQAQEFKSLCQAGD